MAPPTNIALNVTKETDCTKVTHERKYYRCGNTFVKRSLRPHEWQQYNGYMHVPRFSVERILNEGACLAYLAEHTDIPLPKLYACFEDDGAAYLITEHVEGVGMDELEESHRAVVTKELEGYVRVMHSLKSAKWGGFVDFVIPPWRIMNKAQGHPWRLRDRASETLVFCHNDLSPYNVIVDPATLKIKAIIDWEYAGFFPPEFDKAYYKRLGASVPLGDEVDDVDEQIAIMERERAK